MSEEIEYGPSSSFADHVSGWDHFCGCCNRIWRWKEEDREIPCTWCYLCPACRLRLKEVTKTKIAAG